MRMGYRRLIVVFISFILQIYLSMAMSLLLSDHLGILKVIYTIISMIIVLNMVKNSRNLSYHLPWIILIMIFPIIGGILYLIIGNNLKRNKTFKRLKENYKNDEKYILDNDISKEIKDKSMDNIKYLLKYNKFPVTKNNDYIYYPLGDYAYVDMINDLKKASKFIFMEYFIISKGVMWNTILNILEDKVKQGVEVRVMYDDAGSIFLPNNYPKILEAKGIKCTAFNPLKPFLGVFMNNRDHRKIMIIDGKIAYTGGMNIADEYINKKIRFGKWKDNALRIYGDATWNFTVSFLTLWNSHIKEDIDYTKYKYNFDNTYNDGYAVTYFDTPLDDEELSENIYLNIINKAKKYVYICTPYLIIDNNMLNAIALASKRGVDVRIIVPGIPDKKIIYTLSTSYFEPLIKCGVKIYKYRNGFIHSKVFVSDDTVSTVGTVNLDFRSLYLHFECGVYLEEVSVIKDIKKDIEETLLESDIITNKSISHGLIKSIWQALLRLVAPLL